MTHQRSPGKTKANGRTHRSGPLNGEEPASLRNGEVMSTRDALREYARKNKLTSNFNGRRYNE